jgi:tRNA (guanine6-N2)-methyltransferase
VAVTIIARSVRGLEWVAAAEVSQALPAASRIAMAAREVTFQLPGLERSALGLRTVDDAFLEVGRVNGLGQGKQVPQGAAHDIAALDWAASLASLRAIRPLPRRPRFDVVASLEGRHSVSRFAVENAVGEALSAVIGGPHLARTSEGLSPGEPDLTVRVFVRDAAAIAALRLAGRPLHRRWYKQDTGPGTLHPPVAAALARLADPGPAGTVADPFCGDGTIAIETVLWRPGIRVLASDTDPVRLGNAERNAARAGAGLTLRRADATHLPWPPGSIDALITNPPWNVSVAATGSLRRSMDRFWRRLPGLLVPAGRACLIIGADLAAAQALEGIGYQLALATQVRLAGRVSGIVLCAPPGRMRPHIPAALSPWRDRALAEGVVTGTGF